MTTPQLLRRAAIRYTAARAAVLREWHKSCCPEPEEYPEYVGCPHLGQFKELIRDRIRAT